jgi:hypothetical protein
LCIAAAAAAAELLQVAYAESPPAAAAVTRQTMASTPLLKHLQGNISIDRISDVSSITVTAAHAVVPSNITPNITHQHQQKSQVS